MYCMYRIIFYTTLLSQHKKKNVKRKQKKKKEIGIDFCMMILYDEYTGKSMAGSLDHCAKVVFKKFSTIFWYI
jgi:hypothetical protein